jgi:hypothetical protein
LLVWNNQDCFFREIKSPNDKLSDDQEYILTQLVKMGIDAEVQPVTDGRPIKPIIPLRAVVPSIAAQHTAESDTFSLVLKETVDALERLHSLRQEAFPNELAFGLGTTYFFISDADGLEVPYVQGAGRASDLANNFSENQNKILAVTMERWPKEYSELEAKLNAARNKLNRYLSDIDAFELKMKNSYFELPYIWISSESGKLKFGFSIDGESFTGGKSKPFFLRQAIATLELFHKEFLFSSTTSKEEFRSWYCRFTEQSGGPVRAKTLRAAMFKFYVLRPWILTRSDQFGRPAGPIICDEENAFPGVENLNNANIEISPAEGYERLAEEATSALRRLKAKK